MDPYHVKYCEMITKRKINNFKNIFRFCFENLFFLQKNLKDFFVREQNSSNITMNESFICIKEDSRWIFQKLQLCCRRWFNVTYQRGNFMLFVLVFFAGTIAGFSNVIVDEG